jgi:hypothetical protein
LGGILYVWLNGRVSPGTIDIGPVINILVIAVLGGMRHPHRPLHRRAALRAAAQFRHRPDRSRSASTRSSA